MYDSHELVVFIKFDIFDGDGGRVYFECVYICVSEKVSSYCFQAFSYKYPWKLSKWIWMQLIIAGMMRILLYLIHWSNKSWWMYRLWPIIGHYILVALNSKCYDLLRMCLSVLCFVYRNCFWSELWDVYRQWVQLGTAECKTWDPAPLELSGLWFSIGFLSLVMQRVPLFGLASGFSLFGLA